MTTEQKPALTEQQMDELIHHYEHISKILGMSIDRVIESFMYSNFTARQDDKLALYYHYDYKRKQIVVDLHPKK